MTSVMASFFVSPRDYVTISNPTRSSKSEPHQPTVEEEAWPDEAKIASLMAFGFTFTEAFHMSPRDYRRYASIQASWSIPKDQREGGVRMATQADVDKTFVNI